MLKRWRTGRLGYPVEARSASAGILVRNSSIPSSAHSARIPVNLLRRLLLLSILYTLELIPITLWLDGETLAAKGGLLTLIAYSGAWVLRGLVAFTALFITFAVLLDTDVLWDVSSQMQGSKTINLVFLAAHLGMLTVFVGLSQLLYLTTISGVTADLVAVAWLAAGSSAIVTGACSLIAFRFWRHLLRATGTLWIYALMTAVAACLIGGFARTLWGSAAQWTFVLVNGFLKVFLSRVFVDLSTMSVGTTSFHVEIAPECSGLEGVALMLSFCVLWLWLFRREFRFPRALLIIPASVGLLFLLNALRIATLILIGNAGAPGIALGGFHSQAGWIAFNGVAMCLVVASRRMQWITTGHSAPSPSPVVEENPAAPYLAPFLLTLAVSMISTAASAGFEWLYPLRMFAAGAAFWIYRRRYKDLDWRFGWEAPAAGALVFVLWLGGDWLTGMHPQNPLTRSADSSISMAQNIWLMFRLAAPIVTVPIAEELAFRGYLIRRIISRDFETLSPKTYTATSLVISSLAFGLLHGNRWIAGTVAGLVYAAVLIRGGRIGSAVVAHATTNGLLVASVLVTGQWNLS
jgi:exosortase E/protease (VPEID-CTERM system)